MAIRREFQLLLVIVALLSGEAVFSKETPQSSTDKHVVCDEYLARPNYGILHITGRVDRRQMKNEKPSKGRHDALHQSPVLVVSTSAVNESTACQKILSVNDDGLFQTDVAVSDDFSTWSIAVTACASQNGKHSADQCRTVHVEPPGEPVGDGCLPAANRVVPTGHDHPDKSHYAVRVDFRRCFEHRQSGGDKPRVVKVRRTRRQAGMYPLGQDDSVRGHGEEEDLERLGEMNAESRPQSKRRPSPPPAARGVARGNTQDAGKVPAGREQWTKRDRGRNWKAANGDPEQVGLDEEPKRRWEKSGLAWMKKDGQRGRIYDASEGDDSKRRWEKSGMSWMKRRRDDDGKRRWEKSGMSWMKRRPAYDDDDDHNYYNNDYQAANGVQPAETAKRRWEKSGVSWIRRRK